MTNTMIDAAIAAISSDDLVLAPDVVAIVEGKEISWYVTDHGTFTATVSDYLKALRLTRKSLVSRVLSIYEGCSYHGEKGDKISHWRGYDKRDLALIVASCFR